MLECKEKMPGNIVLWLITLVEQANPVFQSHASSNMPVCYCARLLQWRIITKQALQCGISRPISGCIKGQAGDGE